MDKIIWWKLKAKFQFPRFWQKVAKCFGLRTLPFVYATFFPRYRILFRRRHSPLHCCQAHAKGTFNFSIHRDYQCIPHNNKWKHLPALMNLLAAGLRLVTRCTDISMATPWLGFVCLIERSSCYDCWELERASGLMHSLRLELWAQAEGCTAEGMKRGPWRVRGALQRGSTHKQKLLSGCQTSVLSFIFHQSITIQWCYWGACMLGSD